MSVTFTDMTAEQNKAIRDYANILNEIRVRILGINTIITGTSTLEPWLTAELGYLQLRMLCELVALGCIVVHGDIDATKSQRLRKEYSADHIIKILDGLHSDFYPHPIRYTKLSNSVNVQPIETGFLTKNELLTLYHECGEHLHRGRFSHIYHPINPKSPPKIERLLEWGEKFSVLLSQHRIASLSKKQQLVCFLSHTQANNNSLVIVAKSIDE